MLINSSRILPVVCALLAALPFAVAQMNLIDFVPQELLDLVPDICQSDSEERNFLDSAFKCTQDFIFNDCIGIISKINVFSTAGSWDSNNCTSYQGPFRDIACSCTPCIDLYQDLIECIVFDPGALDVAAALDVTADVNITADDNTTERLLEGLFDECPLQENNITATCAGYT